MKLIYAINIVYQFYYFYVINLEKILSLQLYINY